MDMTDEGDSSLFSTLCRLAVRVEKGTKDAQDKEEKRSNFHYHTVMNTITDLKKDVTNLKNDSFGLLSRVQKEGCTFDEITTLCQKVVEIQKSNHAELEEFLKQYGYIACTNMDNTVKSTVGSSDSDEHEDNTTDEIHTPLQTVQDTCRRDNICKSPKLEDFGISQYTVKMKSKFKGNGSVTSESMYVPSPFQHSGIVVTPSILGGRQLPMFTPDKSCLESSPCPPIFQTPGMTQIMKVPPLYFDEDTTVVNSPIPPVFKTPGAKQIFRTQACRAVDRAAETICMSKSGDIACQPVALDFQQEAPSTPQYRLEEPEEPDVSFQALSQMTRSYSVNVNSQMPAAPGRSESNQVGKISEPVAPPQLQLSSRPPVMQHYSTPVSMEVKNPFSFRPFNDGDMPKSPEFLLKYSFTRKENVQP